MPKDKKPKKKKPVKKERKVKEMIFPPKPVFGKNKKKAKKKRAKA